MNERVRLGVNIDHVATIRNARGGAHPDPVRAAKLAIEAGADSITLHVREDRRHVREGDLIAIAAAIQRPINFEMACSDEMLAIALAARPHAVCLVPEKREERTTEGGLDVARQPDHVARFVRALTQGGSRVSLFIDPHPDQIAAAKSIGAPVVELHTGDYCHAVADNHKDKIAETFEAVRAAAAQGDALGLEIHAGHGITFDSVKPLAALPQIRELNIGHFLIGEAVFTGLGPAIREMRRLMDEARGLP